jgi:hypothetical protein
MNGLRLLFVTDTARDLIILPERSAVSARRYSTLGGFLVTRCSDSFNGPKGKLRCHIEPDEMVQLTRHHPRHG